MACRSYEFFMEKTWLTDKNGEMKNYRQSKLTDKGQRGKLVSRDRRYSCRAVSKRDRKYEINREVDINMGREDGQKAREEKLKT